MVDNSAVSGTAFYFTDNTAMWVEVERVDSGIYGLVHYEIDPNKPIWMQ